MKNIAIFVSGSGTNCENIINYFHNSTEVHVSVVVSNRQDAYALVRAENHGVPAVVMTKKDFADENKIMSLMNEYKIDYIILAGFLLMVPDYLINAYDHKIINIHPALLPKFGGKGMYGMHVHEAVKAAGEKETGITVHYVSSVCDGGDIISQFKTALTPDDSADDIAAKIHVLEQAHFPQVIEQAIRADK